MQLSISGDKRVAKALKTLGARATPIVSLAMKQIAGEFLYLVKETRLKGRSHIVDGQPGLIRRSGNLARQLNASTAIRAKGDTLGKLEIRFGLFDQKTLQYARVHELGTVGAGGSLPDIVPIKGKYLRFPVRDGGTAARPKARGKAVGWVSAKKVAIPPRFKFRKTWEGFRKTEVPKMLAKMLAKLVAAASKQQAVSDDIASGEEGVES